MMMARIRSIKPEFWSDEKVGALQFRTRLLFIALWNYADDYGRGRAVAKLLNGFAFPCDDDVSNQDVEASLQELHESGRIKLYSVGAARYYQIVHWEEHQSIDRRSKPVIPNPDGIEQSSSNAQRALSEGSTSVQRACGEPSTRARFRNREQGTGKDSLSPKGSLKPPARDPDATAVSPSASVVPPSAGELPALTGNDQVSDNGSAPATDHPPAQALEGQQLEWFELFWAKWPAGRRRDKPAAMAEWARLAPDRETCRWMASALKAEIVSEQWQTPTKIPFPTTWLRKRRWEDHPKPEDKPAKKRLPQVDTRFVAHSEDELRAYCETLGLTWPKRDLLWDMNREEWQRAEELLMDAEVRWKLWSAGKDPHDWSYSDRDRS
jgi:hypothetical protein